MIEPSALKFCTSAQIHDSHVMVSGKLCFTTWQPCALKQPSWQLKCAIAALDTISDVVLKRHGLGLEAPQRPEKSFGLATKVLGLGLGPDKMVLVLRLKSGLFQDLQLF